MKRRFVHDDAVLEATSAGASGPHQVALGAAAVVSIEATLTRAANGDLLVERDGLVRRVRQTNDGETLWLDQRGRRLQLRRQERSRNQGAGAADAIAAPMTSRVVLIQAAPGDVVSRGQVLIVVEAMKMEQPLRAPRDGVVATVTCTLGQLVDGGVTLLTLASGDAPGGS